MELKICEEGHFYDTDKYDFCPTCEKIELYEKKLEEDSENTEDIAEMLKDYSMNSDEKIVSISEEEYSEIKKNSEKSFYEDIFASKHCQSGNYVIKDDDIIMDMEYESIKIFRNRAKIVKRGTFEPKCKRTNVLIELNEGIDNLNVRTSNGLVCYSKSKVKCLKGKQKIADEQEILQRQEIESLYRQFEFVKNQQNHILNCDFKNSELVVYDELKQHYLKLLDEEKQIVEKIRKMVIFNQDEVADKYADKNMLKLDLIGQPGEKFCIEVEYETYRVSWEPYYSIEIKSDSSYAIMTMFAKISDNVMEEELKDVKVVLSSGVDTYDENILDETLGIQYIKKKRDIENMKEVQLPYESGNENQNMKSEPMFFDNMFGMKPIQVREKKSEIIHEFEMPWKMTLLPGGCEEVVVWQKNININKNYFAIPRKGKKEYFSVNFKGLEEYDLICGWTDIFIDSDYVRRFFIDFSKAEYLNIDLGSVKGVKVNSTRVVDEKSIKRLQGKTIRKYKYEFEVINELQSTISLKLFDRIPISKADGVDVLVNRLDGIIVNETTGRCIWQVKVEPVSTEKIVFEYAISYPSKEEFIIE